MDIVAKKFVSESHESHRLCLIIIAVLILIFSVYSTNADEKVRFKSGELIVKFKGSVQLQKSVGAFSVGSPARTTSDSINVLIEKFGVTDLREAFKTVPKDGLSAQAISERLRWRAKRVPKGAVPLDLSNIYKLSFPKGLDVKAVVSEFNKDPYVEFAQPNYIYRKAYSRLPMYQYTDDPYLYSSGSWGQSYPDLWGLYRIKAPEAWDIATGSNEVVVAVIDTGVDYNHEELQGKVILCLILASCNWAEGRVITWKFSKDIDKDGKNELLIHDLYEGNAAYGQLRIYSSSKKLIFLKDVQGECYLWHPKKHVSVLNPDYFPDLDKDGVVEILVGHREEGCDNVYHCEAEKPWWFDVYRWSGKAYVLANDQFPDFYKDELAWYQSYVKEKGECASVREFIKKAEQLSGKKQHHVTLYNIDSFWNSMIGFLERSCKHERGCVR